MLTPGAGGTAVISDVTGAGWLTIRVMSPTDPSFLLEGDVEVGCGGCGSGTCAAPGAGWFRISSIEARFGLGRAPGGQRAGDIFLRAPAPDPANATPSALSVSTLGQVEIIRDAGGVRQVVAPETFVDVVRADPFTYELRFYRPEDRSEAADGIYGVAPGAAPFVTWRVENPDRSESTYHRLRITEDRGGPVRVNEYAWDEASGTWTLSEGNGQRVTTQWETESGTDRLERVTVTDASGVVASDVRTTYRRLTCGAETREVIVERVVDPDGLALTTAYGYYDASGPAGSCGLLASAVHPDGSWARYAYDDQGRKTLEVRPWMDTPAGTDASRARAIRYGYTPVDPSDTEDPADVRLPRTITEEIAGVVVARTYRVYASGPEGRTEIVERAGYPAAPFGDPANERT